ncbi:DUF7563 family protein [Salinilacihabitans rarus]|uniref:DUF7563 family protein n=1 Tax=Salinilacihabitans rarus TaxID=2961596 RepID=UPI0020C89225|nr:hypothetical protein [Salinilacihabitans rarus]
MTAGSNVPVGRFSDYGANPGVGRACLTCGAHLTNRFVKVFEPERRAGVHVCPNCADGRAIGPDGRLHGRTRGDR